MPVIRSRSDYHELFRGSAGHVAIGEASPSYLCDPSAAERIKSAIPSAKIIISLRNPVERAFSHYLMDFHRGTERLTFEDALEFDQARRVRGWGTSAQYIELGLYANQVKAFLDRFGRNGVLVILFEDLVRDTKGTMQQVAQFLGIDPGLFPESAFTEVHNASEASRGPIARTVLRMRSLRVFAKEWIPRPVRTVIRNRFLYAKLPKPRLEEDTRRKLAERFADDVSSLERLLERDLSELRRVG
jgi:hypothetical protein